MLEENMRRWRNSVLREGRALAMKERREAIKKEYEQGQIEGMRRLLLKQMRLRFGPLPLPVRRQLREISSLPELENLASRLLTATKLSDLGIESP